MKLVFLIIIQQLLAVHAYWDSCQYVSKRNEFLSSTSAKPPEYIGGTITNLNEYLSTLADGCLVHIKTFKKQDFIPPIVPIMLQLQLVLGSFGVTYGPPELKLHTWSQVLQGKLKCPLSNLFHNCNPDVTDSECRLKCEKVCSEISFHKFVVASKPWNCEAEILLSDEKTTKPSTMTGWILDQLLITQQNIGSYK